MRKLFAAGGFLLLAAAASCTAEGPEAPRESLLKEKDRQFIVETAAQMKGQVRMVLFTSEKGCEYCSLTEGFLEDVAGLSPQLSLEVLSLDGDRPRAEELGVDKAPGIALLGARDYGIRYYGLPTGYEFITFVETLRQVAEGDSGLLPETVASLDRLKHPVTITVFSTKS